MELLSEQQNLVPDAVSISQLFCDAYNQKATTFFRPMTPQEQQARQQKMMMPLQAKQQLQDSRLQAISDDSSQKNETALIQTVLTVLASTGLLNSMVGVQTDAQVAAQKALEATSG